MKTIIRRSERVLLFFLILGSARVVCGGGTESYSNPKLILSADTANEIDDLYAIVRTLKQEKFEVLALASAQ